MHKFIALINKQKVASPPHSSAFPLVLFMFKQLKYSDCVLKHCVILGLFQSYDYVCFPNKR